MSNPYPSEFHVVSDGGQPQVFTAEQFASALRARSSVPKEVSISVKESRQRIKFNQVERFISARLDFGNMAELCSRVHDETQHHWAKQWAMQIVEQDCLTMEDQMSFWMEAMFGKANVQTFLRSQDNPWVRGGQSALEGARLAGLVTGGHEKNTGG